MVGPMVPCALGKDKLKRPKRWTDWHKDAENKMRFMGITDSVQKMCRCRAHRALGEGGARAL